ncbi:MAG: nucleotide sugar dehydrogenase [Bacteroidota bacterium]|nr:nucleotide sugar dehydrogenase [Bacteroidota bacterium]
MEFSHRIAVIGLGYVGLPLAVEFAKKYPVIGFDINTRRIEGLRNGIDYTLETDVHELKKILTTDQGSTGLFCSDKLSDISSCNFYIITVPTPTDKENQPDLNQLYKASEMVGEVLKKGDVVIYESTVYPGVTEEKCAPILEKKSGLKFNADFFCGYSPERINPGDRQHSISKIVKITSGSTPETAKKINQLYMSVIEAGTYMASSIKVAEAAKLVENSQRDINIAFINEIAKILNLLTIDTDSVLEAAGTKWNFLKFKPGLVGGHCIGAAPNYLIQKSREAGYNPEIILAGRKLNDSMGAYVAAQTIKCMVKKDIPVKNANVLIMGFTFKENCPDIRNTRTIDIIKELESYQVRISIFDPWVDPALALSEYGITILNTLVPQSEKYDAIVLSVAHNEFSKLNIGELVNKNSVIYDVKSILGPGVADARL